MDIKTLLLGLVLVSMAGCLGDDGDDGDHSDHGPHLTAADCEAKGMVLGEEHMMDNETGEHEAHATCVEAGPPATVTIEGLPATAAAYSTVNFTWVLDTPQNESHAMRTEVRYDTAPIGDDDLGKPDDWGTSVALKEHQNFAPGQTYEASFMPTVPGDYYFRAYALVSQTNIWSAEFVLNVTEPAPTGVVHDVEVTAAGFPGIGSVDPSDLTITIGDAVQWATGSGDPDTYTITSTNGPASFSTETGGDAVVFLVPGSYTYDVEGSLSTVTGAASGTISVVAP